MRYLFVFALLFAGITQTAAQEAKIVLAAVQPFEECLGATYSPVLRSGCFTVPRIKEEFEGTAEHPAVGKWVIPPMEVQNRVYPVLPASLQLTARPVLKKQGRRLLAKRCANCKFVSAQTAQGKELSRQFARRMGIQASSIIGYFVPFPFSIAVNTLTCAAVSVGFDAKEYREDYKEEPTSEQYAKSFASNMLYCSPIGGFLNAKTPVQFLLAALGFSSYFVNLPTGVGYAQQALPLVDHLSQRKVASRTKPIPRVATSTHKAKSRAAYAAVTP